MLQTECPSCHAPVQYHELAAGSTRRCPRCKITFVLPLATGTAKEGIPQPQPPARPGSPAAPESNEVAPHNATGQ
jgi:hypothetical protein